MILLDGRWLDEQSDTFGFFNRGFKYGDAVFETIKVQQAEILFAEDHYLRLMASMRILRMQIPETFTPDFFYETIKAVCQKNHLEQARIKFYVWRDSDGLYTPTTHKVSFAVTAAADDNPNFAQQKRYHEVGLFKDHYLLSGLLSSVKSNNKATHVLAGIFAQENDYDNMLLMNERKNVVCAINGNLFLRTGNEIITPPAEDGAIKGIVRKNLLLLKDETYQFSERSISPFELQKADEVFITNIIQGICSVGKYKRKSYETSAAEHLQNWLKTRG
ncbi:MAG: aminotransferase class IV [Flavobacteriaceae bacterium]|nr:aminotransferase class IV [Flavobacteriaceae bacterium]